MAITTAVTPTLSSPERSPWGMVLLLHGRASRAGEKPRTRDGSGALARHHAEESEEWRPNAAAGWRRTAAD